MLEERHNQQLKTQEPSSGTSMMHYSMHSSNSGVSSSSSSSSASSSSSYMHTHGGYHEHSKKSLDGRINNNGNYTSLHLHNDKIVTTETNLHSHPFTSNKKT